MDIGHLASAPTITGLFGGCVVATMAARRVFSFRELDPAGKRVNVWKVLDTWARGRADVHLAKVANDGKIAAYDRLSSGGIVVERDTHGGVRMLILPAKGSEEVSGGAGTRATTRSEQ